MPIKEDFDRVFVANRVRIDDGQPVGVELISGTSSFGEAIAVPNRPIIQVAPVYNYLPANFRAYTTLGGTGTVSNGEFYVHTGTTANAYAAIQSFRSLNYKAGQGGLARWTARFKTGGVANSWQGAGLISIGDELSFGYNGTAFGIWHRYRGQAEVRRLTVTGAAGGAENATVTINGTAYTVPLTAGTTVNNAYEIAAYLTTNASGIWATQNDSEVTIVFQSDGAKSGTYAFTSATATATWSQVAAGVTKTSVHIPQASWNTDTAGWLDPTKGNVYQVNYQYLGYGNIFFSLENPDTGRLETVHVIKWANGNTATSMRNPSMRMGLYTASLGSTTDIELFSASMAAFVQGVQEPTRNSRALANVNASVGTTITNILTIRNRTEVNGLFNQVEIQPLQLAVFTESVKGATIEVRANPTFGAATDFTYSGTNLVTEYDVTSHSVTGGNLLASYVIPGNSSQIIDLSELQLRIPPTLTVSIAGKVNSGAASPIGASIVYYEDV